MTVLTNSESSGDDARIRMVAWALDICAISWEWSNIVNLSSGLSKLNICGDEKTMEYILTISTTAKVFKTQIHVNKL